MADFKKDSELIDAISWRLSQFKDTSELPSMLEQELRGLDPSFREIARECITNRIHNMHDASNLNKRLRTGSVIFGVLTFIFMAVVALCISEPSKFQYFVFRVIISIGAGACAGGLTGFFDIKAKTASITVAAGGGLGVFFLVYWFNPPGLIFN